MRFRNYRNSHTNDNKIYSVENIQNMTVKDAFSRKQELLAQNRSIGVPTEDELKNSPNAVWVDDFIKDDGSSVKGHWRSKPEVEAVENIVGTQNSSNDGMTGGAAGVTAYSNIRKNSSMYEYLENNKESHNDEAMIDNETPFLLMGGVSTTQKAARYVPYLSDIWNGKNYCFTSRLRK